MAATTEDYAAQGGIRDERLKRWVWFYSVNVLHRDGDLPAVIYDDGSKHWYFYGTRHREGGPAFDAPGGHREWWFHGKLHRIDGPATEMGPVPVLWCVDGKKFPNGDDDEYQQACREYLAHKNKGKWTKGTTGT